MNISSVSSSGGGGRGGITPGGNYSNMSEKDNTSIFSLQSSAPHFNFTEWKYKEGSSGTASSFEANI